MPSPERRKGGGWKGERGTRQERGYGKAWQIARSQAIARDKGLCQPCKAKGRVTPFTEVDHITPKAKGGTDDLGNLQCICAECHKAKSAAEGHEAAGHRARASIGEDGWPIDQA